MDVTPAAPMARYLRTLRHEWFVVVAMVAASVVGGVLVASRTQRPYEATATVVVDQQRPVQALFGADTTSPDPQRDLNTSVGLIGAGIADQVRAQLRLPGSSSDLLDRVSVAAVNNSNVVSITARADRPQEARAIANGFADRYQLFRASAARAQINQAIRSAQARITALGPGGANSPLGRQLAGAVNRLETVGAVQTGGVEVVRHAPVPLTRAGVARLSGGVLAAVLGLALAGAMIMLLTRLDRRVHDRQDIEHAAGVPVVAEVPRARPMRLHASPSAVTQAHDVAAARLEASRPWGGPVVLLVTSTGAEQGVPELALGLAGAFARLDRSVIVIGADLRDPGALGGDPSRGLAAALRHRRSLESELHEVAPALTRGQAMVRAGEDPEYDDAILVLPAGRADGDTGVLVGRPAMREIVESARQRAAMVILACAPLSRPAEVLPLVGMAHEAILVACGGRTGEDSLRRAVSDLGPTLVGVVTVPPPSPLRRWASVALRRRVGARTYFPVGAGAELPGGPEARTGAEAEGTPP